MYMYFWLCAIPITLGMGLAVFSVYEEVTNAKRIERAVRRDALQRQMIQNYDWRS